MGAVDFMIFIENSQKGSKSMMAQVDLQRVVLRVSPWSRERHMGCSNQQPGPPLPAFEDG